MSQTKTTPQDSKAKQRTLWIVLAILAVGAGIGGLVVVRDSGKVGQEIATFVVKRGPMTISVLEAGTIKSKDQTIIKNEVEGLTSIISLITEGTQVKKGDLLIELDASSLVDEKINQEIQAQNAEASFINATETLAVTQNQAQSDIEKAKLTLQFAKQDVLKYKEGEFPNELMQAENQITLAKEQLERAQQTLDWSQKLYNEKYIAMTELQADKLAVTRSTLDLKLAESNLDLLRNYTYQRQIDQFTSDVNQADMALERTTRKARADVVQAEADLKAKEAEFKRQQDKLAKLDDQIKKTKIIAPTDGLVIYATSAQQGGFHGGRENPLQEGLDVRERQELIYLPTGSSAVAEVGVHEASLEKVRAGLRATITVDALPGKKFLGIVSRIAPLPDPQSMWMNPDLKIYYTQIVIDDEDPSLRTGMSCRAEILVQQYDDAMYIPVQAVFSVAGEPTAYVVEGKSIALRKVQLGLDNNVMVHIVSGLKEGEAVLLNPPLKAAGVDATSRAASREPNRPWSPAGPGPTPGRPGVDSGQQAPEEGGQARPIRDPGQDVSGGSGERRSKTRPPADASGPSDGSKAGDRQGRPARPKAGPSQGGNP